MKTTNRWMIAAAGMMVMMTLGTVYSWSLFVQPLSAAFGWSSTTATWTFALAIFFVGVGAVVGGRWQDRVGPRRVTLIGVTLWSMGNILTGLGTPSLGIWWMYLAYGVIGGFGVGMGYITPVATVVKWFRERRGLAGGMVVAGFGLGAVLYNLVVNSIPAFLRIAGAAANYAAAQSAARVANLTFDHQLLALSQEDVATLMNVFIVSGAIFLVLGGLCAWLLVDPPQRREIDKKSPSDKYSYNTREMLLTSQFYQLWAIMFVNVTAGILLIGNALPIMQELTDIAPGTAAAIYAAVALCNAGGRFLWGMISDRIGRKQTFIWIFAIQAGVFLVLPSLHSIAAVTLAYAVILLCLGGGFGTMPSFNADYFGTRHMGANYGAILTAWGCAGIAGPLFASSIKDLTGSYTGALIPIGITLLAAIILPLTIKKPTRADKLVGQTLFLPAAKQRAAVVDHSPVQISSSELGRFAEDNGAVL